MKRTSEVNKTNSQLHGGRVKEGTIPLFCILSLSKVSILNLEPQERGSQVDIRVLLSLSLVNRRGIYIFLYFQAYHLLNLRKIC